MTGGCRAWLVIVVALAVLAVLPAPALAAVVFHVPGDYLLGFQADSGEANRVTVTQAGGFIVVTDEGVAQLQVGGDCVLVVDNPRSAQCPEVGVARIDASMGDLADELTNTTAVDTDLRGQDGSDSLRGGSGSDIADGGPGDDLVEGGPGADSLYGASRNSASAAAGSDTLNGGPGADTVVGGAGADVLDGGSNDDTLSAGDGDDSLSGGDGNDQEITGDGNDIARGDDGADIIGTATTLGTEQRPQEYGNDVYSGGPGNDMLVPGPGPAGVPDADTLSGDAGFDTVNYSGRTLGVQASKDDAPDDGYPTEGDNVGADVEHIVGGSGDDVLRGGPQPDSIEGGAGADRIDGLGGDDVLQGDGATGAGGGSDTIAGGSGSDIVQGDGGEDTLLAGEGSDKVNGGTGADTLAYTVDTEVTVRLDAGLGSILGAMQPDAITQVENVEGGKQQDTITGDASANELSTGGREDYLEGGPGRDGLRAGAAADFLDARNRDRDGQVSCGPGVDFALVDQGDPWVRRGANRCEQVDDGTQTRPQSGREVFVQPRRCAASDSEPQIGVPAMTRLVPLRDHILVATARESRAGVRLATATCAARVTVSGKGKRATSSAVISGGRLEVAPRPGRRATALLSPERPACGARARASSSRPRETRVAVRTRGRGRWRVKGHYSIAASYATAWTTIEQCGRTITRVLSGHVRVFDRVRRRTVDLGPGQQYVARARR